MSQHELIAELKRVFAELGGKVPTRAEFRAMSQVRGCEKATFGSWTAFLHAADLGSALKERSKQPKFKYQIHKLESFKIHEVDLLDVFAKAGNPESLKAISMPDTHVKHCDRSAVGCFLNFIDWYQPHLFNFMGDFLDAEGISHWPADSLKPRRFIPEVIEARELMGSIMKRLNKCVMINFLTGNHEDWIAQAMAAKLPEFFDGLEDLGLMPDLAKLLEFEKYGIKQIPLNEFLKIGKAHFTHGLYTGKNHPKDHIGAVKGNIYYGHLHDSKSWIESGITGLCEAASLCCLCRLDAPFMKGKPTGWAHGFGIHEFFRDGSYTFMCPKIHDGKLSFAGKVFSS